MTPTDATPDPWKLLESLVTRLGETTATNPSVALAVETARQAVGADTAFWFSKTSGKVSGLCGRRVYTAEQAAAVGKAFHGRLGSGAETLLWEKPTDRTADGQPTAAVIAADPRTQGCIVALSFDPDRRFDDGDTKAIRMALKMLLALRAQGQTATKAMLVGLLQSLTAIVDEKDPYTIGHSERVARIAVILVRQMGQPGLEGDAYLAGLLHDVGNVGLPDQLHHRPQRLTHAQLEEIRRHPVIGEKIVASLRPFDRLRPVVRNHHEHFNGAGYPDGLEGEAIPLLARVIAVADACDAMMSPRRYRAARSPYEVDAVIHAEAGRQFDPKVVQAFMAARTEIYPPIYQKEIGESAFPFVAASPDEPAEEPVLELVKIDDDR